MFSLDLLLISPTRYCHSPYKMENGFPLNSAEKHHNSRDIFSPCYTHFEFSLRSSKNQIHYWSAVLTERPMHLQLGYTMCPYPFVSVIHFLFQFLCLSEMATQKRVSSQSSTERPSGTTVNKGNNTLNIWLHQPC